jgi:lipopolysaccharide biosynthesis protein
MQDVCLFAHYDKDGKVDDYVLRYLRELRQLNFSVIFVSTARLGSTEVARLAADCEDVILRENAGLDFGSWSAGFAKHGARIEGRLLLANDSVYGPIGSLRPAFERLTREPADFYGFVESIEVTPHPQSWFLLFEPGVVHHPAFAAALEQPFAAMSKREIIACGEVGMSQHLLAAGFRYQPLYKNDRSVCLPVRHAANPMLLFWREVLFDCGVPFLKIELLRDNPFGVEDAAAILQSVERIDPASCAVIKAHLARMNGPGAQRRPQRPLPARLRYALIRKRYCSSHDDQGLKAAFDAVTLELMSGLLMVWRTTTRLFGSASLGNKAPR